MYLSSTILQLPYTLKPHRPSPLLHGSFPSLSSLSNALPLYVRAPPRPLPSVLNVRAVKLMQGKVVRARSNKTVAVEVTRYMPHPKYKKWIRVKKKYQVHDPENKYKVGDYVQLQPSRPISKTKSFIAIDIVSPHKPKAVNPEDLPRQSQQ